MDPSLFGSDDLFFSSYPALDEWQELNKVENTGFSPIKDMQGPLQQSSMLINNSGSFTPFSPPAFEAPAVPAHDQVPKASPSTKEHAACGQCYWSKIGCDKKRPCARCISSGRAHLCQDRTPGEVLGKRRKRKLQPVIATGEKPTDAKQNAEQQQRSQKVDLQKGRTVTRDGASHRGRGEIKPLSGGQRTLVWMHVKPYPKSFAPRVRNSKLPSLSIRWLEGEPLDEGEFPIMNVDINDPFEQVFGFSLQQTVAGMESRKMPSCPLQFLGRLLPGDTNRLNVFSKVFLTLFTGGLEASTVATCSTKTGTTFESIISGFVESSRGDEFLIRELFFHFTPLPKDVITGRIQFSSVGEKEQVLKMARARLRKSGMRDVYSKDTSCSFPYVVAGISLPVMSLDSGLPQHTGRLS